MSLRVCPNCKKSLLAEAIREGRPFSCPNCRQIISSRTPCLRYGTVVFWIVLLVVAFLLARASDLIVAILLGTLSGGVLAFFVMKALNRFRARESVLIVHENGLPPDELRSVAALAAGILNRMMKSSKTSSSARGAHFKWPLLEAQTHRRIRNDRSGLRRL